MPYQSGQNKRRLSPRRRVELTADDYPNEMMQQPAKPAEAARPQQQRQPAAQPAKQLAKQAARPQQIKAKAKAPAQQQVNPQKGQPAAQQQANQPKSKPVAQQQAKPKARPAASQQTARPATRPATQHAARPAGQQTGQQISQRAAAQPVAEAAAAVPAGELASRSSRSRRRRGKSAAPDRQAVASGLPTLKIIPLGGMREIGKNLTVYEYGSDMIVVDCGIAFPEEDMPGIDVVIPDFSYLIQNKDKLRGIFLTHGHEDHIGALPWLCKDIQVPIYGNRLTLELVRLKLEDRGTGVSGVALHPIKNGVVIPAGCFSVEFIHVNHSIADANALAISTPVGVIYHSGDFKIDYTPINGGPMDLSRIAAIGAEGVLAMVCESTNIERRGHSPSESLVGETFADLFGKAPGRIIVATFSSNVFRLQQIFTAAEQYNRKVALVGRSLLNVFNAANSLNYLTMRPDTLIDVNQIDRYDADQLVLISTGSQGEPMSALTRMAFSEHRRVEILPDDTVIISASPIPGNEKPIYRVINELFRHGAHVIYESLAEIHVSGHAYVEELKLLHSLLKPRYFIPAHGEYRHLYRHAELAHVMGLPWENIFLLNNGDIFEYADDKAHIGGVVPAGGVLIDGTGKGDVDTLVLRDRRQLSEDGIVTVFLAVDRETGDLIGEPDIQARGFIYESETDRIIQDCRKKIHAFVRKSSGKELNGQITGGVLRDQLSDLLAERTRRRPIILISLIEV
jgi:ribonuclease J